MLYDEYEAKVVKRGKVKHKIYRLRFVIAGAALIVLGTPSGLISTKGLVNDVKRLNTQYTYGEIMEYLSSAFLSDVSYEFKNYQADDNAWVEDVPRKVGKYTMRSKSKNSFNSYYYGSEQDFEIVPMELELNVANDSYTYGDEISFAFSVNLAFGDKLTNTISPVLTYGDDGKVTISPLINGDPTFIDSNKEDVSKCYSLKVNPKIMEFKKRKLEITGDNITNIYDDQELKSTDYKIVSGSLAEGDYLSVNSDSKIVNVGKINNDLKFKVYNAKDEDVSSFYDLTYVPYSLSIEKRKISFTSDDKTFIYDGEDKEFTKEEISIDASTENGYGLIEGHTVSYNISDNIHTLAGEYENKFTVSIFNGENDVTENYEITYNYGKTSINKRPITISSPNKEIVYDGQKHSFVEGDILVKEDYGEDVGGLVSGHEIKYELLDKNYTDAGTYENKFTVSIFDGENEVTDNYDITYSYGSTTIDKRPIAISSPDKEFTYDGEAKPFVSGDVEVTPTGEGVGLVDGHNIEYTVEANNPTYVGSYDNEFSFVIKDGEDDVTANYETDVTVGKTIINKRPITIVSNSATKTYDGESLSAPGYTIIDGSLADKDKITGTEYVSYTNVGTYDNTQTYKIVDKTTEESMVDNYDFTYQCGTLTINKRPITIALTPVVVTYDGNPHSVTEYTITDGSLAGGEAIELKGAKANTEYGVYSDDALTIDIKRGETSTLDNYDWAVNGKQDSVTINKRPLTVTTKNYERVYNATSEYDVPRNDVNSFLTITGLASSQYVDGFTIINEGNTKNVGTYSYFIKGGAVVVRDSQDVDRTNNYDITYNYDGEVTITKRDMTLTFTQASKMYDGTPFSSSIHTTNNLVEGHYCADFVGLLEITHTWESAPNSATSFKIFDENDEEVTANYNTYFGTHGYLTILPRPLSFASSSITKTFDATPINEGTITLTGGSLAVGDTYNFDDFSLLSLSNTIKHVSQSGSNTFTPVIYNSEPINVTLDYDFSLNVYGTLTIKPLPIVLGLENEIIIYDGTNHAFSVSGTDLTTNTSDEVYIQSGTLPTTYHIGATISIDEFIYVTSNDTPNTFEIEFNVTSTTDTDIELTDYDVSYDQNHRYIVPRPITFTSISGFKQFDGQPFGNDLTMGDKYWISSGTLGTGDTYEITDTVEIIAICVNEVNDFRVIITHGIDKDVTYCYNIAYNKGQVTIYE